MAFIYSPLKPGQEREKADPREAVGHGTVGPLASGTRRRTLPTGPALQLWAWTDPQGLLHNDHACMADNQTEVIKIPFANPERRHECTAFKHDEEVSWRGCCWSS